MELVAHLLTKNNEQTIENAINSLKPLNCHIVVIDRGSTDKTLQLCRSLGVETTWMPSAGRSEARNKMIADTQTEWHMYLEPWEMLVQGHMEILKRENKPAFYLPVIRNTMISKEIRLWRAGQNLKFINPVFERLDAETTAEINAPIYSGGETDRQETLKLLEEWKHKDPAASAPYYYQACILLAEGKYEDFLNASSHYMFLEPNSSMSSIMNRYYYAMVEVCHKKRVKPALQNLNLCLCAKPLMAEFWCLTGDVYYHLLRDFKRAKQFYENAIILGKFRLKSDKWPMDIEKYGTYPSKMIESCVKLIDSTNVYAM